MSSLKKLENMSVIILALFIIACLIAIVKKVNKSKVTSFEQNKVVSITVDSSNNNVIIINGDTTINDKTSIKIEKKKYNRRTDLEIKTQQRISFLTDEYVCDTQGWDHGEIVWSSYVYGSFEYIKEQSKIEKKKCDNFLYGVGAETSKRIKELQNQ